MDLSLGYCRSQGLAAVARLGIADLLADGARSGEDLAKAAGADEDALFRMLRALTVEGIFDLREGRVFANNEASSALATEHPRSVRWFAASMCDHAHWQPWGKAWDAVVQGKSQTEKVLGSSPWEYLSGSPEEAGRFGLAMSNMSLQAIHGISAHCEFGGFEHIVDVGGNRGTLLLDILGSNPGLRGTIFDLPPVIKVAARDLEGHPLADRIRLEAGSFFEEVPAGADAYLLKHILHDWPDGDCDRILSTIRRAIPPHGRLFVFDALLVPEAPGWAHWLDVHMFVLQDGKERSPEEFTELLERNGFHLERAEQIPAPVGVLEAVPV
jgi:hypothetical protein